MKVLEEHEMRTRIVVAVITAPGAIVEVVRHVEAAVDSLAGEAGAVSEAAVAEGNFFGPASGARQFPLRAWTVVVRG